VKDNSTLLASARCLTAIVRFKKSVLTADNWLSSTYIMSRILPFYVP